MTLISMPITKTKIAKQPVVVVSLRQWEEIEASLEDAEMISSVCLAEKIAKARKEKKVYSSKEIKKKLRLL